jgi:lipopolysaccharide/colanic/teichoic acid biosynthesis glycosyltransferase
MLEEFDPQFRSIAEASKAMNRKNSIVGRLDSNRVGIVLPGVEESGAKLFASSIRQKLPGHLNGAVRPEVYVYGPCSGTGNGANPLLSGELAEMAPRQSGQHRDEPVFSNDGHEGLPPWKRTIDILGAILALIVLSPVMLLLAAVIKITSRGPILFTQERVGYQGRLFHCFKFRTMAHDTVDKAHREHLKSLINSDKPMKKLDGQNDPRLIPGSKLIRAAALDELLQLFNVLRGEMSLVGPRPAIPYEYREYETAHKLRFSAVPGMTGLWQVCGKNRTTFNEMVELDIGYFYAKSLWLDLKIIAKTPGVLIQQVCSAMKRNGAKNDDENKHGCGWVRVLGTESDSKF